jgi:small subunit ribosomal protein S6
MKNYEIMYILMPDLDADGIKNENLALQKLITDNGGKITGVNEWGMRDLAYAIKKQVKGYYVVLELQAPAAAIEAFDKATRLNQKVLRFLVTVAEK